MPVENNPMFLWISSFHMPLFMALAGLFAGNSFSRPYSHYVKHRSKQLLLPWITWSSIIIVVVVLLDGGETFRDVAIIFFDSLWFLKSLFICGFLALVGFKPKGNRLLWIIVSFMLSQICLVWNVFIMYPCFLFGILCSRKMQWLESNGFRIMLYSGFIFLCLSIWVAFSPEYWMKNMGIRSMLMNGSMSLTENIGFVTMVIFKRYSQVILGCLGSLFFITLFMVIFNGNENTRFVALSAFGQFTLGVYVIQTVLIEKILPHYLSVGAEHFVIFDFIIAPAISVAAVVICLLLNNMILKSRLLSVLLLGK